MARLRLAMLALCLLLPLLLTGRAATEAELRAPAPLPAWPSGWTEWRRLPGAMEAWLNDHFGLRPLLVGLNARLRWWLGQSASDQVVIGRDGWLFFTGDRTIDQHRGLAPFAPDELDRWIAVMRARRDRLAARGVPFLLAAIPDKETVYADQLPAWIRRPVGERRLDQLARRLAAEDLGFLDLRPVMAELRGRAQAYLRRDTHWTFEGAHAGTAAMAARLGLALPAVDAYAWEERRRPARNLDLARLLGLEWGLDESVPIARLKDPDTVADSRMLRPAPRAVELIRSRRPGPRIAIVHDSFMLHARTYLPEVASAVLMAAHDGRFGMPWVEIEAFEPDFVIYAFAERFLIYPPPWE